MSGHSKWSQIRRQKGVNDAKRGQIFTKLGREISVAARQGGGDPEANFRLRLAVQRARENNMPMENVERAIKRGTGGGDMAALEEIVYEGYGPGGAAVLVEVTTDNRNRSVADIRNLFAKNGGNLGESGCVNWLFEPRGVITVELNGANQDDAELQAIDAGAVDVTVDDGTMAVVTNPNELDQVRRTLEAAKIKVTAAENALIPSNTVALDSKQAQQMLRLIDRLEELDDVQNVYTNTDFDEEVLAAYNG